MENRVRKIAGQKEPHSLINFHTIIISDTDLLEKGKKKQV